MPLGSRRSLDAIHGASVISDRLVTPLSDQGILSSQGGKMQTNFVALVTIYGEFLGDVSRSGLEAYLTANGLVALEDIDQVGRDLVVVM